jgi:ring-1,2-phenylacetyl-CoA epoxidase subunit PaaE
MGLFDRLRSLRRDLAAVAATLNGQPVAPVTKAISPTPATVGAPVSTSSSPPAPAVDAAPSSRALASALAPRPLRIARIVRETADAVSLVLEDPTGAPIAFAPGQFFTLHVSIGGEIHKRAYSASSSALDGGRVAVTVKRVADGRVSRHLVGHAHEGDPIDVLGPSGSFIPPPAKGPRLIMLIGGGSGITPLFSIARTLLASEPETRIALVYGNLGLEDVIFHDALDALVREYSEGGRLRVRHVLEKPPAGWPGGTGKLDGAVLGRELDELDEPDAAVADYFLCGPAPMMSAARVCLEMRGVSPVRIREERFISAHSTAGNTNEAFEVTLRMRRGGEQRVMVSGGKTVLEAALDASIDMPFSCAVGGCGTCRVKVASGSIAQDEPNCLSAEEHDQGYVLACVSRPTSACTLDVP